MKKILGISAFYHDAAAAILVGGEIVAAAQEERFTRIKHDPDFPEHAIRYCLEEAGLSLDDLDAVVFYEKPLLKFERLLETYYAFAPRGLRSFLRAMPAWLGGKLFLKKKIRDGLDLIGPYARKELRLLFSEHHLAHAASAFFTSPFTRAAVLTIDGVGEWCTSAIYVGERNELRVLRELHFPHSVGLLYSAFAYYLGFRVNSGEYKLMGLAPYGDPEGVQTCSFVKLIENTLIEVKADGSIWLDPAYFNYATGATMTVDERWEALFGIPRRLPDAGLLPEHGNLALAIQQVTEGIVLKMAGEAKRLTGADNLCLAGGVALNCVANGRLRRAGIFRNIYVQPAAGDAGAALGAALAVDRMFFGADRPVTERFDPFLGPAFSRQEIVRMNRRNGAVAQCYEDFAELADRVSQLIAEGHVVGWFQGRMEFGPRALGNRSILADPRDPEMQRKLNFSIKYREGFRPFAPAALPDVARELFELEGDSPYMLFVAPLKEEQRIPRPDGYADLRLAERLGLSRSSVPAVTHLDYSARVQTVDRAFNLRFHTLLEAFRARTGCGLLINTSFNVRGEPVVCTPDEAYRCFRGTELDYLVIDDFLYCKPEQPGGENPNAWRTAFRAD